MKTWQKYRHYLAKGEWHVHTNYVDGASTVMDYCQSAVNKKIPLIAFTEHVHKNLDFSFESLLCEIEDARAAFPELVILSGCEAKVLEDGSLDVSRKVVSEVDYPIFSYHTFHGGKDLYMKTLRDVIRNEYVNAWAHPGLFLSKIGQTLSATELDIIMGLLKKHKVLLEKNRKYNLPPKTWLAAARKAGLEVVNGSDAHSVEDIG